MNYDLYNEITAVQSLGPAARTATANGSSADLQGYESCLVEINAGAWTDGRDMVPLAKQSFHKRWKNKKRNMTSFKNNGEENG